MGFLIDRICISINNRCNLNCLYCHFHNKGKIDSANMDVFQILDNVKHYVKENESAFKIGFVGNGEPFLDWSLLKSYISFLEDYPNIKSYTITNGTIDLSDDDWLFLEKHNVNVGFSIDGYKELHNINRCNSFDSAIETVEHYKNVTGHYPTFNSTIGTMALENSDKVIDFFKPFNTRITFSRMIGENGISLENYRLFLDKAEKSLSVRRGGDDCTMYGGRCGAGINNYFFANGFVYYCGNCIDLPPISVSSVSLFELEKSTLDFNSNYCYKESL